MPAKDCKRFRNLPPAGEGHRQRGTLVIVMAALFAAAVLTACVIVNPPPAPTPTPMPTPTPTRQTIVDVVRIVEGGDPAVTGQTVRVALTLEVDSYTDRSRWQWERSDDGLTNWRNVPATRLTDSSLYAPVVADEGKYLRASVSYVDSDDEGKIALSPTVGPVIAGDIDTTSIDFDFGNDPAVVGRAIRAFVNLPNSDYSQLGRWRWDRSDNALRDWVDVTDYESDEDAIFTPSALENGKYLRVSAVYLEREGDYRRGLSQTIGPVITVETVADVVNFPSGADPPEIGSPITVEITLTQGQYRDLGYWKWERSDDGLGKWEDITNYNAASTASYTPTSADSGKYLRASALYIDSEGERKRALSQTIGPVIE